MARFTIPRIQNVLKATSARIFGRVSAGTGRAEELTAAQVRTLLSVQTAAEAAAAYQPIGNYATLVGGLVPSSQLPSYVDDVIEAANLAALPATGETGKIYVALDTGKTYRWSGSTYAELTDATAVWGSISGTLSNQTDLQNALNAKAASSHTHTTSDITGFGEAVDDEVASLLVAGANITITYNDAANTLTIASTSGVNSFVTVQPQNNGTNGTAVVADSSSDTLTVDSRHGACITGDASGDKLTLDCFGDLTPTYTKDSTVYELPPNTGAASTLALVANRLYKTPIFVCRRRTITDVAIVVSTLAAGSNIRLGLRRMSLTDGEATTLVADFGVVSGATTGTKTITGISVVVDAGWYYLEVVSDGTPTIRCITSTSQPNPMGSVPTTTWTNVNGLFRAFTYGTLPSDETGVSQTLNTGATVPTFGYR